MFKGSASIEFLGKYMFVTSNIFDSIFNVKKFRRLEDKLKKKNKLEKLTILLKNISEIDFD